MINNNRQKRTRYKLKKVTNRKRLSVFRSNNNIYAQIIDDKNGKTIASASSLEKEFVKMEKDYFSHLSSDEKHILKDKGTEAPFTGEYNDFFQAGIFVCRACKSPLYESNTKFDSGCGWPSFDDEIEGAIVRHEDLSGGRVRTEICCSKCTGRPHQSSRRRSPCCRRRSSSPPAAARSGSAARPSRSRTASSRS